MPVRGRVSTTLLVVGAAAALGLLLAALISPIADALDANKGLVEYTAFILAWHLGVLAIIAVVLPRLEGRPFGQLVGRWWVRQHRDEHVERPAILWAALIVIGLLSISPLRLWAVDTGWDLLAGPEWSVNSPAANRGDPGFSIGAGVLLLQLLVRIPLTVFVEETLFRGWVQDRHGPIASGALFAAYHWSQWWTIGALLPFGLALSLLRVATRSIWPGAILHGAGNASYAVALM